MNIEAISGKEKILSNEFYLFKKSNNERFNLGKSYGWSNIFEYNKQFKLSISKFDLFKKILIEVAPGFECNGDIEFFSRVTEKIIQWCSDDIIEYFRDEDFIDRKYNWREYGIIKFNELFPFTGEIYE